MDHPDDVHGAREFVANTNLLIKFHGCTAPQSVHGVGSAPSARSVRAQEPAQGGREARRIRLCDSAE
jgi:hypothetical protein